jgi:hypothetical protein
MASLGTAPWLHSDHHWAIMPDENGKPDTAADPGFANARGGKYMQSLPDTAGGGQNNKCRV